MEVLDSVHFGSSSVIPKWP